MALFQFFQAILNSSKYFLSFLNYPTSHPHILGQYPTPFHLTKIFFQYFINSKAGIYINHHFLGLQRNHIFNNSPTPTKIILATRWYPQPISPKTLVATVQNFQNSINSNLDQKQIPCSKPILNFSKNSETLPSPLSCISTSPQKNSEIPKMPKAI
jgi:hypothetical protein